MGKFVIFRSDAVARCSYYEHPEHYLPNAFEFEGRVYSLSEEQIPLFDHLLDSKGNLVGFYFHGLDSAPLLAKSRIVQARNVVNEYSDGQTFSFNLAEIDADQIENDCCQAMPAYLFSDGTGDFLVVVPDEWKMKWKELGFPLEMQASPKPMFQNSRLA